MYIHIAIALKFNTINIYYNNVSAHSGVATSPPSAYHLSSHHHRPAIATSVNPPSPPSPITTTPPIVTTVTVTTTVTYHHHRHLSPPPSLITTTVTYHHHRHLSPPPSPSLSPPSPPPPPTSSLLLPPLINPPTTSHAHHATLRGQHPADAKAPGVPHCRFCQQAPTKQPQNHWGTREEPPGEEDGPPAGQHGQGGGRGCPRRHTGGWGRLQ